MHDAHFLCYKASLQVAQTHSNHPPHPRSPQSHSPHTFSSPHAHALQELKDDLLDDTEPGQLLCSGLMKIISIL